MFRPPIGLALGGAWGFREGEHYIIPNASCLPRTASMVELTQLYPRVVE